MSTFKALSRPVPEEEEQPEEMSRLCKANNISKIFTNFQLRGGSQAGNFTNKGAVSSYHKCVGYCCQDAHCNVALTLRNICFLVSCKTYSDCLLDQASGEDFHSQVVYVNWEKPTERILTKGWQQIYVITTTFTQSVFSNCCIVVPIRNYKLILGMGSKGAK